MDLQVRAVKNGWLPFFPQFDRSPLQVMREARSAGAESEEDVGAYIVRQLRDGKLKFAVEEFQCDHLKEIGKKKEDGICDEATQDVLRKVHGV